MVSHSLASRPRSAVALIVVCTVASLVAAIWIGSAWFAEARDDDGLARVAPDGEVAVEREGDRARGPAGLALNSSAPAAPTTLVEERTDARTIAGLGSGPTWLDLVAPRDAVSGALVLDARVVLVTSAGRILRADVGDAFDAAELADAALLRIESPEHEPRHVTTDGWFAASLAGGPPRAFELVRRGRVSLRIVGHEESDALSLMLQVEPSARSEPPRGAAGESTVEPDTRSTAELAQGRVDELESETLVQHLNRLDSLCDMYGAAGNVAVALAGLLEDDAARALLDPAVPRVGGALRGVQRRYVRGGSTDLDGLPVGEPLELDVRSKRLYRARVAGSQAWYASTDFAFVVPAEGRVTIELEAGDWASLAGSVASGGSAGRIVVFRALATAGDPDPDERGFVHESSAEFGPDGDFVCERLTPGPKRVFTRWVDAAADGAHEWVSLVDMDVAPGVNALDLVATAAPDRASVRCIPRIIVDGVDDLAGMDAAAREVIWSVVLHRDHSSTHPWNTRDLSGPIGGLAFEGVRAGSYQVQVAQAELREWLKERYERASIEIGYPTQIIVGSEVAPDSHGIGFEDAAPDPPPLELLGAAPWRTDGTPVELEFVVRIEHVRRVLLEVEIPTSSGLEASDLPRVAVVARERTTGAIVQSGRDWEGETFDDFSIDPEGFVRRLSASSRFELRLPRGDWELVARLAPRWTDGRGERAPLEEASYFATGSVTVLDVESAVPLVERAVAQRAATIVVPMKFVGAFGTRRSLRPASWPDDAPTPWGGDAVLGEQSLVFHGCVPGVEYVLAGSERTVVAGPPGSVVEL